MLAVIGPKSGKWSDSPLQMTPEQQQKQNKCELLNCKNALIQYRAEDQSLTVSRANDATEAMDKGSIYVCFMSAAVTPALHSGMFRAKESMGSFKLRSKFFFSFLPPPRSPQPPRPLPHLPAPLCSPRRSRLSRSISSLDFICLRRRR